jgi:hypothetical protein
VHPLTFLPAPPPPPPPPPAITPLVLLTVTADKTFKAVPPVNPT